MTGWPEGKKFAFTIMDDTDRAYLQGVKPFYDELIRHGLRTTKTVWALESPPDDPFRGDSLQNPAYRAWILDLQKAGFEIAWHGARSGGTERSLHADALERFREIIGAYPRTYANHAVNPECLYWGEERFDAPIVREIFRRFSGRERFLGSTPGTPYNWEDLCAKTLRYVRGFNFDDTVTSRQDPWMPYHDPRRPAALRWFSASDGSDVERFVRLLAPARLDALEPAAAAASSTRTLRMALYETERSTRECCARLKISPAGPEWYVPVDALLDHIEQQRGEFVITTAQHRRLEWRWAAYQVRRPPRLCVAPAGCSGWREANAGMEEVGEGRGAVLCWPAITFCQKIEVLVVSPASGSALTRPVRACAVIAGRRYCVQPPAGDQLQVMVFGGQGIAAIQVPLQPQPATTIRRSLDGDRALRRDDHLSAYWIGPRRRADAGRSRKTNRRRALEYVQVTRP